MSPDDAITVSGMKLRLVPMAERHRGLYHALYGCPEVMRAIGGPLDAAAIDAQFDRVLRHNAVPSPGHRAWAIEGSEGAASEFGLVALLRDGSRAELGVMLRPTAMRRRIATRAIAIVLPHAFGILGLKHVDASRRTDAHVRVIDKLLLPLGFIRTAGLRPGETGWSLSLECWGSRGRPSVFGRPYVDKGP